MAEEDNFDIYGDLNDFDASVKLKETTAELEALKEKHGEIVKKMEALEAVNRHTKAVNGTMKKNFGVLLNTARAEVQRKDGNIVKLREERDNVAFRRSRKLEKMSKWTQTDGRWEDSGRMRVNGRHSEHRKSSYDRFKDSMQNDEAYRGRKRRYEGESSWESKRRRSRPRSPRKEEKPRQERKEVQKVPQERKSRKLSEKKEDEKLEEERAKVEVPKSSQIVKEEEPSEEIREETITAVENLLQLAAEVPPAPAMPPLPPEKVPEEPPSSTPEAPEAPEEEKMPEKPPNAEPQAIESPNKSINLGNTEYSVAEDNQGVVTVFIKRKKRKLKK